MIPKTAFAPRHKIVEVFAPEGFPAGNLRIFRDCIEDAVIRKLNAAANFDKSPTLDNWAAERQAGSYLGDVIRGARSIGLTVAYPIN